MGSDQIHLMDGTKNLRQIIDELMKLIDTKGLATLLNCKYVNTNLAVVRKQEIMAAINRYRKL